MEGVKEKKNLLKERFSQIYYTNRLKFQKAIRYLVIQKKGVYYSKFFSNFF